MPARPWTSQGRLPLCILLGLLLLLAGCAPQRAATPSPAASASAALAASAQAVQPILDRLTSAVREADPAAFRAATSLLDPRFGATREWLFANLGLFDPTVLQLDAEGAGEALPLDRQALLPGGWVQPVTATWAFARPAGQPASRPVSQRIDLVFVAAADGTPLLAGAAGPVTGPTPIWLLGPVQLAHARGATVVGADPQDWVSPAESAAAAVGRRLPANRADLVIQVATDEAAFERVLGVAAGSYAGLAAVAWPMGTQGATSAVQVVVNGAAADNLSPAGRTVLLTHEATHVMTNSAASPAPLWLVEGYADEIAYAQVPGERDAAAEVGLVEVDRDGPPAALPADARFAPGADDLALSYAQAWLACRYAAEEFGARRLDALYAAVDSGRPLAAALPETLGVSEADFVLGWQRYLRQFAAAR